MNGKSASTCASYSEISYERDSYIVPKHHVAKLWVFGSVFSSHFTKSSDIDFLYEWDEQAISAEYFLNNMWDLLDSLEALFGHTIDWIYAKNLQNPYFIEEIEETKVLLYDQESEKVSI
ncbi:MAG: nucleotidyltransferase domain-containing protein [Bacteroidota bacterium]